MLLHDKGNFVATIAPGALVSEALAALADHGIGALVVSPDDSIPVGIVSERDVVRHLHSDGTGVLDKPVSAIMSTELHWCSPGDEVESLREVMTTHRIRHVPVLVDGRLAGIVSIGDVVKSRIGELEGDRQALYDFINAR